MTSTHRLRIDALVVAALTLATARLVGPLPTDAPPEMIRVAQVYADPIGEEDGQIGGPSMYGYPVGNGPIGGPTMYGPAAGEGDGQIGGPTMYGYPVGNGAIGGAMVGGAPVGSGGDDQPIGGDTLY